MKLGKFLFTGSLSLFALAACVSNDDKSEWNDGSQAINFTSSIQGLNTRAANAEWTAGDKVGIFMKAANGDLSTAIAANKLHTTDENGNLTASNAENALYYPTDGSSVDFVAYYPYVISLAGTTYKVDVATQTDQPAIDLLYSDNAKGFAKGTSSTPQLTFAHMLSQIVFNIEKDATIPTLDGLKVTFKGMNTKADFTLADGKLGNAGTVADIAANVDVNGATATTIVLPAAALSDIKVVFDLNGKSYTADYPQTVLDAGRKYVHKVKLSDSNGQPVIVMEAATITDWIEVPGGDIDVDFGGGSVTPPTEVTLLDEPFDANQGTFTIDDKVLPEGSTYVWKWNTYTDKNTQITTQYMKASAFINNANKASESWLISPAVNLSNVSDATLSFEHCHKFGAVKENEMSVWIANAGTTDWHQLTIPTWGTGNDYTYVTAEINLKAYVGNSVQIAFKYVSTESAAATWQINAVKVVGMNGEGGETPPTPGGGEKTIFEETFGDATGKTLAANTQVKLNEFTNFDNTSFTFFDRFADPYKNADIRTTKSIVNNHLWLPAYTTDKEKPAALKISGFNVEGYTNLKLSYSIAANAATDQNIIKVDCGGTMMTVPSVAITKSNVFQTVELDNVPDGITYIELISDATNKIGFRIDNIKLVGTTK